MRIGWAAILLLAGCSGVTSLDEPRRPLLPGEPPTVREKSEQALAAKDYGAAWTHEFHAGADRARLETIFLAALAADAGNADDMMEQLRKAHGGLTPASEARVKEIATRAESEKKWVHAAEIHILAASDPPAYTAAWEVYRRAPPKEALSVLETIQDAREEHQEAAATKRGP